MSNQKLANVTCDACCDSGVLHRKRCPHCLNKRNAQAALIGLANCQLTGLAISREWAYKATEALGGCPSSVDKMLIDGRTGEVGVYLLTLIFDNLKPKQ